MEDASSTKPGRVVVFQHLPAPGWKIANRVKLTGYNKNMTIVLLYRSEEWGWDLSSTETQTHCWAAGNIQQWWPALHGLWIVSNSLALLLFSSCCCVICDRLHYVTIDIVISRNWWIIEGYVTGPVCLPISLFVCHILCLNGKGKGAVHWGIGRVLTAHLPHISYWARWWIDHWVCDAWPVQCQTYRSDTAGVRYTVTFPATEHHRPLAGTKLYCLVTEAHGWEQCA